MKKITSKSTISFIKRHWRTIIELLGFLGIILAILELNLQNQQFRYEQSQKPLLEYSYTLEFSETDRQVIFQVADEMIASFYDDVAEYLQTHSNNNYREAITAVLPMTLTIPANPIAIEIQIDNKGMATATQVRVNLEMDRAITSLNVNSKEIYQILQGGIGEKQVIIEIDRITAGDRIFVEINSEDNKPGTPSDQIVLGNFLDDSILTSITYDEAGNTTSTTGMGKSFTFFPEVRYMSAKEPVVSLVVTSNEGAAQLTARYSIP